MKIILLVFLSCHLSIVIAQQKQQRQFKAYSNPYKIYVTPNNTIWVNGRSGHIVKYNPSTSSWTYLTHKYPLFIPIDKPLICFFDKNIGIIPNNIDQIFKDEINFDTYYRTTDGGNSWNKYTYDSLSNDSK